MANLNPEEEIDRLYALPLPEFIGARNELAKRLKAGGDGEAAAGVKALAKPSVTAWAVNALYRQERLLFDELLAAAASVRAALGGKGDRRQAEAAKRQALKTLLGRAAKILASSGHAATPANRQRISHTLESLAARDPAAGGPRPGRLTADLEPQGFDALAGLAASLAPAAGSGSRATKGAAGKRHQAAAKASAQRDNERLEAALRKLREEEAGLSRLEREAEEAAAAAADAAQEHERLTEAAAEAARLATAAKTAAAAAKDDLATARAAAARAKTARRRGLARVATARRQVARHER